MDAIYCSERWFPSSKLKSRETMVALACVVFISLSYYLAVVLTHESILPFQIQTFFHSAMDDDEANPEKYQRAVKEVFDKAAMPNRTVIITTLNAAWAEPDNRSMVDMFLESFHHGDGTERLLQHLIIVCVDQRAYERCLAIHPHCLIIKTGGVDFSGEQLLLSEDYIKMIWRRIKFLKTVLEMDYSFIFTDADVLWLRDPFPRLQSDTEADFQIACDYYNGIPWDVHNSPNAGFTYVRANERTSKFYKYWYYERKRSPKMADQEVFNSIKLEETFKSICMKLRFLDTQFFGGFCSISVSDMTKAITMHATCCKGLDAKLTDLRMILEGWKKWKQRDCLASTHVVSTPPIAHETSTKNGSEVAPLPAVSDQDLANDPHFKGPQACPRSWR